MRALLMLIYSESIIAAIRQRARVVRARANGDSVALRPPSPDCLCGAIGDVDLTRWRRSPIYETRHQIRWLSLLCTVITFRPFAAMCMRAAHVFDVQWEVVLGRFTSRSYRKRLS